MSKSSTIIESEDLPNPSPGEILRLDFLEPAGVTSAALGRALHLPARRIQDVLRGRRRIDADVDLQLSRYFGVSAGNFLGLQADFDVMQRRRELGENLEAIEPRAV